MTRYEILLFLHIAFVIVGLGSGFLFHVLGFRADRAHDEAAMAHIFDDLVALANALFIPSSLLVVIFGILLTLDAGAIVLMAAVVAAGAAFFGWRARTIAPAVSAREAA
jgi:hypothetical protein